MDLALQRAFEPLEHTLDLSIASRCVGGCGEAEVDCAGQKPSQLLEGDEFRVIHIDHHAVMIDPKPSFQAHTPLEEAADGLRPAIRDIMRGLMLRASVQSSVRAESGEVSGPEVSSCTAEKRRWKIQQENS